MGLLRVAAEDHGIQGAVVRIAEVLDGEEGANGFALLRLVHQGASYAVFGFDGDQGAFRQHRTCPP
ncbi:hypothetical protein D3C78_1772900 [compost metagenome]